MLMSIDRAFATRILNYTPFSLPKHLSPISRIEKYEQKKLLTLEKIPVPPISFPTPEIFCTSDRPVAQHQIATHFVKQPTTPVSFYVQSNPGHQPPISTNPFPSLYRPPLLFHLPLIPLSNPHPARPPSLIPSLPTTLPSPHPFPCTPHSSRSYVHTA